MVQSVLRIRVLKAVRIEGVKRSALTMGGSGVRTIIDR